MSYSVNVYTDSTSVPTLRRVRGNLVLNGWQTRLLDSETHRPIGGRNLKPCLIVGWPTPSPREAAIVRAADALDQPTLDRLYASNDITSCRLYVERPYRLESEATPEELGELREEVGARAFRAMCAARALYILESYAGRNSLAIDFQLLVAALLGALCGGLIEDPQSGVLAFRKQRSPKAPNPSSHRTA